jgi:hypothetical protein
MIPAILLRISTGEILKRLDLLTLTADPTQPIAGLDPDLKVLVEHQPFPPPEFDERIWKLVRTEDLSVGTPHPVYPAFTQYLVTYSTEKRPAAEIKAQIGNAHRRALEKLFPAADQITALVGVVSALLRTNSGLQLTPDEQAAADAFNAIAVPYWRNCQIAKAKCDDVDAGREPDIDADWEQPATPPAP